MFNQQNSQFRQPGTMQPSSFPGVNGFAQNSSQPFQNAYQGAPQPTFGGSIGVPNALPASNPSSGFMAAPFQQNQGFQSSQPQTAGYLQTGAQSFNPQSSYGMPPQNQPFGQISNGFQGGISAPNNNFQSYGQQSQGKGTVIAKYKQTNLRDDNTNINVTNLMAMNEYSSKSVEELRYEDYKFNDGFNRNTRPGMNQMMPGQTIPNFGGQPQLMQGYASTNPGMFGVTGMQPSQSNTQTFAANSQAGL